jgi:hypothetical protein
LSRRLTLAPLLHIGSKLLLCNVHQFDGGPGDPYNAEEVEVGRDSLLFSSEAILAINGPIEGGSYFRARERHSTAAVRIVMDALASHAGAKT